PRRPRWSPDERGGGEIGRGAVRGVGGRSGRGWHSRAGAVRSCVYGAAGACRGGVSGHDGAPTATGGREGRGAVRGPGRATSGAVAAGGGGGGGVRYRGQ